MIDCDAGSVLLIGDTMHDYEVANDAGWQCTLYLEGHQDAERLKSCGCRTFSDLAALFA